jgi:hypothetical protein
MTPSFKPTEVESLLDRAVELLVSPTLGNLRGVEELLREAVVRMPDQPDESVRRKVRVCGRLLDTAERGRPGGAPAVFYTERGTPGTTRTSRLSIEA